MSNSSAKWLEIFLRKGSEKKKKSKNASSSSGEESSKTDTSLPTPRVPGESDSEEGKQSVSSYDSFADRTTPTISTKITEQDSDSELEAEKFEGRRDEDEFSDNSWNEEESEGEVRKIEKRIDPI